MALAVGTKAPDFSLATKTADGPKQIKLSDNFGKQNTLLLFFPMAFTGTCTTEMCSLSPELPNYAGMNATVYGISGDNPFAQEAWATKENISVTLLSDYEHNVAKQYDVMYDSFLPQINLGMSGVPKRSAFVVDRNGVIQYAESNDDAKELKNFDAGNGREGSLFSLPPLEEQGVGPISRLPVSIRIVLESVLRNCDGKKVRRKDVETLANWKAK